MREIRSPAYRHHPRPSGRRVDHFGESALARTRSHRPEFYEDLTIAELPIEARYLYQAMWCWMDKGGVGEANPRLWKQRVFPYDDHVTVEVVWGWMKHLLSTGRLQCYYGADTTSTPLEPHPEVVLIRCPTFSKHQRFHKDEREKYNLSEHIWVKYGKVGGLHHSGTTSAPMEHLCSSPVICNLESVIGRGEPESGAKVVRAPLEHHLDTTPPPADDSLGGAIALGVSSTTAMKLWTAYGEASRARGIETTLVAPPVYLQALKRLVGNCGGDSEVAEKVLRAFVASNHDWWVKKKWAPTILNDERDFAQAFQLAVRSGGSSSTYEDPFAKYRETKS